MKSILLISDTHSFLDTRLVKHIKQVDQVWHAGDIGDISITDEISKLCPKLKAVYGNIDNQIIRSEFPLNLFFTVENRNIWITHIGGYPPKYRAEIEKTIQERNVHLFICGHSHILKVMYDKKNDCLHMNPGAIGKHGFQKVQTALKFVIDGKNIRDLQIIELDMTKRVN